MSDYNSLPSFLRSQIQHDGWVELHSDALYKEGCPFVLRLTEIEFEGEEVLLSGSLYCRVWKSNGEICAFGETKPEGKDSLWTGLSLRFRTWYPKSNFSADMLKYFDTLVKYWSGVEKLVIGSDCPWYSAGSVPVQFQVAWEGLWRIKNLSWGNGSFNGRGTRLASDKLTGNAPEPRKQRFAFVPCSMAGDATAPQNHVDSPADRESAGSLDGLI